ncbi:hypothetical protein E4N62_25965 [Streptomyces sp. MNU76]|uniref:hypothetical protein n=1 Tax=Streptomyces sp. MNU76 TaxID=2560026 RepID=UPI001E5E7D0E|nr:hypothetical protein [Streptomyces sp. MNU76]MCC9708404.1 hypothetical protein [Streptomyces sp. MNU76]
MSSLVPPARLDAFADALRQMGAGWVRRDGQSWPAEADTSRTDRRQRHGESANQSPVVAALSPQPCRTPQRTLTANPSQYVRRPPCGPPPG